MAEKISDEMIEYVGILAKLELSGREKEEARADMEKMLNYIDTLNELETIRLAFLKVFHGMYHERVSYPEQKEIQEAAKKKADTEQEETNSDSTD